MSFVTASRRSVKVWDALTGNLTLSYDSNQLLDSDLTAVAGGFGHRTLLVGDLQVQKDRD